MYGDVTLPQESRQSLHAIAAVFARIDESFPFDKVHQRSEQQPTVLVAAAWIVSRPHVSNLIIREAIHEEDSTTR